MNDFLLKTWERLKSFWQSQDRSRRILWITVPSLVLIGLIALALWTTSPNYSPLFSNLTQEDAGNIIAELKDRKVPYKIGNNGKTISVPFKDVYDLRLEMASKGMIKGGGVGFEIFDKTNLGITDFTQRVNFVRALEGELGRTISNIEIIDEARVHLVLPKKELYEEKEKEPTASVLVKMKAGLKLSYDNVKSIVFLVAGSVEGMKPVNVTIIDSNGTVLSDIIKDELMEEGSSSYSYSKQLKLTNQQMNMQSEFEKDIQRRVESMLTNVLGEKRATVRVNAELSFDQVEKKDEIYEPVVGGKGIIRSSKRNLENYTGVGTYPGGVPGTDSNVPGYKSAVSGNSQFTKSEVTENYEISKKEKHVIETVGDVKRLSIAVIVDNLQPQQVNSIRNAVIAAAGLDLTRGDQVAVENISFDRSVEKAEMAKADMSAREKYMTTLTSLGIVLGILLFALLFLRSTLKPKAIREKLRRQIEMAAKDVRAEEEVEVPLEAVPSAAELAEAQKRAEMKRQITKIARENPKIIVQLIKRWLTEEKR
ncbi:MAG TPA: flagellar basal-body MS-ring/collar protein FliF [Candidatus Goldiibacteriota bacterium]|nr:flagellar basal-body MS-ring/collar protein FliF [Candidatus Goldiibacteriota bacterium]